jgi:hypothetical protein
MKALGGFFELELPAGGGGYHDRATALCSGRACLRFLLERRQPRRAFVPFFICDTALTAFEAAGVPYTFYNVTRALDPVLPAAVTGADCVLYVNYYGLKTESVRQLAASTPAWVIADDTQAFFERGYTNAASFNSARKFFGVPDGAYAYGDALGEPPAARADDSRCEYLMNRLSGDQDLAYQQYVVHEGRFTTDIRRPSVLAERLLAGIDYARARDARRRNFSAVHARLADANRLPIDLDEIGEAVPFCYPFLPAATVERRRLWDQRIFVPQLWPEVESRSGPESAWERELAGRLLPLPIDQRYDLPDMDRLCGAVLEELQ